VSVIIFLACNDKRCDTILPVDSQDIISARIEARRKGWDTTRHYEARKSKWVTEDQCASHVVNKGSNSSSDVTRRFTAEECALGTRCPAVHAKTPGKRDVFHWCGHDQLGHRMANILIHGGYTVGMARAAGVEELLDLRGFGRLCVERWEHFKKADTDG
jgi:hypothetical protein